MGFWRGRGKEPPEKPAPVQLRPADRHPFSLIDGYVPLHQPEFSLYRAIREAVPVVDAAVMKVIRLAGGLSVTCPDPRAEAELEEARTAARDDRFPGQTVEEAAESVKKAEGEYAAARKNAGTWSLMAKLVPVIGVLAAGGMAVLALACAFAGPALAADYDIPVIAAMKQARLHTV